MKLLLLFCFLCLGVFGFAQERCISKALAGHPSGAPSKAVQEAEAFQRKEVTQNKISEDAVIRIPVVVHVLYHNNTQNISDEQILSGIQALNRDFRRRNADAAKTPEQFRRLAADVQIEFFLARSNPQGQATTGIERKAVAREAWLADDRMKHGLLGGIDAWDGRSYLNIWICNLAGGSGYATEPGSDPQADGIVINYSAFGTINTAAPFNMGRTTVHEVGHWLGLKHIWGDTQCGDDGIDDTPQQSFFTRGCPAEFRSSCNNGEAGDMFMNYMDYTNDDCMNLFTLGQRQRMRAALYEGGPRVSLLQSRGLETPWMAESPLGLPAALLYPNPATASITLQTDAAQVGKTVTLANSQGQVIRSERILSTQQTINLQMLKPGVYFLKGESFLHKFVKL
jgi:hypothetical protein